jgi:hypothetical protein
MDPDVQEVIDKIIKKPPMPPNSIALDFAVDEIECDLLDIFDFLIILLTQLCKKMFPSIGKIDLSRMTDENIVSLNKYFYSIGFKLEVDKVPFDNDFVDEIQNNRYDKILITPTTKLDKLYMPIKSGNMIYLIRFDFYK